jgi:hypothetical protein
MPLAFGAAADIALPRPHRPERIERVDRLRANRPANSPMP